MTRSILKSSKTFNLKFKVWIYKKKYIVSRKSKDWQLALNMRHQQYWRKSQKKWWNNEPDLLQSISLVLKSNKNLNRCYGWLLDALNCRTKLWHHSDLKCLACKEKMNSSHFYKCNFANSIIKKHKKLEYHNNINWRIINWHQA